MNAITTASKPPANDLAEINKALELFHGHGVVELRHIGPGWKGRKETNSGYYDDLDKLARDAATAKQGNVYVTLNPVDPSLLARRANRTDAAGSGDTTGDAHIIGRRLLLVDFDAKRPSGISSTDEQHELAIDRAKRAARALVDDHGFPTPVLADSGNGAHLLSTIDLPNDAGATALVQGVLARLGELFGDDAVAVDQTVYNAARITKLYGTTARKGDHTADRPHRLSRLLYVPKNLEVLTRDQLESFAGAAPVADVKPRATYTAGQSFDVAAFVAANLEVTSEGALYEPERRRLPMEADGLPLLRRVG